MPARPIYSHQIWTQGPSLASFYSRLPAGPGQVAVIRDMDFTAPTVGLQGLLGFRVDVGGGGGLWFMGPGNCRGNRSYHWRGRAVIEDPQTIEVTTFDNDWSWTISGYLFVS